MHAWSNCGVAVNSSATEICHVYKHGIRPICRAFVASMDEGNGKPISIRKQTDLYRHARRHPCSKSNLQIVLENSPPFFFFTASHPI